MVLLDIDDNGAYYRTDITDITVDNVVKFLKAPGKREQLGE